MLAKTQLLDLYYWLQLNRMLEDRIVSLRRAGKIPGDVHTGRGHEAISVGTAFALEKDDVVVPLLRNTGALLVRGFKPAEILSQYMGKIGSPTGGRDGCLYMGDLNRGIIASVDIIGSQIPVTAGMALAAKLRRQPFVALTYIGDGGSETSDFHEGLNLAAVQKVPMLLVLEDNGWAFATPAAAHAASTDFAARARAYGVAGYEVDGSSVVDVYETTCKAAQEARSGGGPVLIVAHATRTGGDPGVGDAWFAPRNGNEPRKSKDPIRAFEQLLGSGGLAARAELGEIVQRVRSEIDGATAESTGRPFPEGRLALGGVYHEA